MKNFQYRVNYRLGGRTNSLTAGVKKNITVEPTRAVRARYAMQAAQAVAKSTHGNLVTVDVANANLPSHRRLASVKNGKYQYAAVQI